LVALIVLLVIVVLMSLVGNAGHAVKQKMEVQNAADSAAFATSLWAARGMNTVTACNHMIGEATAIGVIHDAIGGPEQRFGLKLNTGENRILDNAINLLTESAPIGRIPNAYVQPPFTNLDRNIIRAVTRRTSPRPSVDLEAFATIYDARMTLKRELVIWLTAKSVANAVFLIPPPFGIVPAIAAVATHVAATARIVLIGKEWLLLLAIERYGKLAGSPQEQVFASQLIPTLADFAAGVSGLDLAAPDRPASAGFAVEQINRVIDRFEDRYDAQARMIPIEDQRRMPVVFEPKPNGSGHGGNWPDAWGRDVAVEMPAGESAVSDIEDTLDEATDDLRSAIDDREDALEDLKDLKESIEDRAADADLSDEDREAYEQEIDALDREITDIESKLTEFRDAEAEIADQRQDADDAIGAQTAGQPQNPSLRHVPDAIDPRQERSTQWMCATMPNVDALRAPLLGLMKSQLPISHAADHFEKWTNRYALIHAWRFRSGMRLQKNGDSSLRWQRRSDPVHMIVMADSFEGETSVKGDEPWVGSDEAGQAAAEDLFTVLTTAHREYEPLFSTSVLRAATDHGMTAFAQSILYNANPNDKISSSSLHQPRVGWDTLNWDHQEGSVPRWGAEASVESAFWPWDLFNGLENAPKIRLNWQAKLVPVTRRRMATAADEMDGPTGRAMELASEHSGLVSH